MTSVPRSISRALLLAVLTFAACGGSAPENESSNPSAAAPVELLNVSYDPTRELYAEFNAAFAKYWQAKTGQTVTIQQSHGGSGAQARAVIDGLDADVVTLALAYDIDAIQQARPDQRRLAEAAAAEQRALHLDDRVPRPQGQPEGHQGLERPGQARRRRHHAEPEDVRRRALELPRRVGVRASASPAATTPRRASSWPQLYKNVPVLDSGARGATTTFVQRGIGDVLLAWENEAYLALAKRKGAGRDRRAVAQHPRRAAGRGRRQGRRQEGHASRRRGVPAVPLFTRRTGDRRANITTGRATPKVAAKYAGAFAHGEALHDRRGVRRLADGAEGALRRRRHVRSDLQAGQR